MRLGRLQQSTHNTAASDLWNDIRIGNVAETIRVIGLGDVAIVLDPTCGVPCKHPVQLGNKQGALVLSDLCFDMCKIGIGNLNAGPPRVMKRAFIVLFVRYRLKQMDVILVGRQSDVRFWHIGTSKKLLNIIGSIGSLKRAI
jgi:hypothetical protein